MEDTLKLFKSKVHEQIEYYLFRTLTAAGYSMKEAETLAEFYIVMLRTSTFTKANTYLISVTANPVTGFIKLVAEGSDLRNKKDISITVKELTYKRKGWWWFVTYVITKSHC